MIKDRFTGIAYSVSSRFLAPWFIQAEDVDRFDSSWESLERLSNKSEYASFSSRWVCRKARALRGIHGMAIKRAGTTISIAWRMVAADLWAAIAFPR